MKEARIVTVVVAHLVVLLVRFAETIIVAAEVLVIIIVVNYNLNRIEDVAADRDHRIEDLLDTIITITIILTGVQVQDHRADDKVILIRIQDAEIKVVLDLHADEILEDKEAKVDQKKGEIEEILIKVLLRKNKVHLLKKDIITTVTKSKRNSNQLRKLNRLSKKWKSIEGSPCIP